MPSRSSMCKRDQASILIVYVMSATWGDALTIAEIFESLFALTNNSWLVSIHYYHFSCFPLLSYHWNIRGNPFCVHIVQLSKGQSIFALTCHSSRSLITSMFITQIWICSTLVSDWLSWSHRCGQISFQVYRVWRWLMISHYILLM